MPSGGPCGARRPKVREGFDLETWAARYTATTGRPPQSGERPTVMRGPETIAIDSESGEAPFVGLVVDQARALHRDGKDDEALALIDGILALLPAHPGALALAEVCRRGLEEERLTEIGHESDVLEVVAQREDLMRAKLDSVSGFIVSLIDGRSTVEEVLDIAPLPRHAALEVLKDLISKGILAVTRCARRAKG